jgi:CheY-like chemotaxis protein
LTVPLFTARMISLHVVFAENDADIRKIVILALRQDPYFAVRGCASAGEALKMAVAWRPDLVLLDVNMPGGLAVLTRLRADRGTAAIPVVFTTASSGEEECTRLRAFGAAGVIAKPFNPRGLPAQLRRFVPLEGALAPARESFLQRLDADTSALSDCRRRLSRTAPEPVLRRINEIAHALAGAGGIYGFAGVSCEAAALSGTAEDVLAGRARLIDVERALDRLIGRINPNYRANVSPSPIRKGRAGLRYSAATA